LSRWQRTSNVDERQLYYGDNLEVLRKYFRDETIDLCYIDPPFNSKCNYNQIYNNLGKDDQAQAQAFIDTWTWDTRAIEGIDEILANTRGILTRQTIELLQGYTKILGKGSLLAYLVSMTLRIAEIWRVLKDTGSFYLHCDPTCSHYLKLVLDALFCGHGGDFITEIIWTYSWGVRTDKRWNRKHDVILCYTKSDQYTFNAYQVLEPRTLSESSKNRLRYKGALIEKQSKTGSKEFAMPTDVWYIPTINGMAKERLGYPTQKPEALLEKIIKASSNENNIILDAYCGCGTTVNVAERLKRQWKGIDITYQSISVILKRLEESFGKPLLQAIQLNGVPQDMEAARALAQKHDDRVRKEFEKWAVLTYTNNRAVIHEKKGGDKGIDGIAFVQESAEAYKPVIFSVKSGQLQPSMVRDLRGTVERENAAIGILLTLEEPGRGITNEAKTAGLYKNPLMNGSTFEKLQIVTIEEMLAGKRLQLPMTHEVLKKAKSQIRGGQEVLFH
jgi:DNA modification methylase